MERGERLPHIDGLRGVAVGLVMLDHTGLGMPVADTPAPAHWLSGSVWGQYAMQSTGALGVSLFLVLSGFCLSYPAWIRRRQGKTDWFVPSSFFARRCWRILPPYYAALVLFTVVSAIGGDRVRAAVPFLGDAPTPVNVVTHILLIHNLTQYAYSICGAFWSLALEWQWYLVFPLILIGCLSRPRRTLTILALMALVSTPLVTILYLAGHIGLHQWAEPINAPLLPERLFEFGCGVIVAKALADGWRPRPVLLVPALLIAGPISYAWTFLFAGRVVSGIGFALLVGVACTHGRTLAVLSWRPLVRLGVISYSVYLTHQPVEQGAEFFLFKYIHSLLPGIALSLTAGLAFGAAFFWVVERPVLRRESWLAVSPYLLRAVAWTDRVYPDVRAQLEPIASEAPQGALAEA